MDTKNKHTEESYNGEPLLFSPGDIVKDTKYGCVMIIDSYDYECTYKVYNYNYRIIDFGTHFALKDSMIREGFQICQEPIESAHKHLELVTDPVILTLFGKNT